MKPLQLDIDDALREKILAGASHVAVSFYEGADGANGSVLEAGTEEECQLAFPPGFVVVPNGLTYHGEIWDAAELLPAMAEGGAP